MVGLQVKVTMDLYSASKVLRYGTRSERISQFYMHTLRSSASGINHDLPFPSQLNGSHLPTPKGWKAELA